MFTSTPQLQAGYVALSVLIHPSRNHPDVLTYWVWNRTLSLSFRFSLLSNPRKSRRKNLGLTLFSFVTTTTRRTTKRTLTKNITLPGWFSAYKLISTPLVFRKNLQEKSLGKIFRKKSSGIVFGNNLREFSPGEIFKKKISGKISRQNVQEKSAWKIFSSSPQHLA